MGRGQRRRGDSFAARRRSGRHAPRWPPSAPAGHADAHPHRRADPGSARLHGPHRTAADRVVARSQCRWTARWNLVHATQAEPAELSAVRPAARPSCCAPAPRPIWATACSTMPDYAGVRRQVDDRFGQPRHARAGHEELRLLEYSQRLVQRKRNVAAQVARRSSSAQVLFESALAGGETATLRPLGAIAVDGAPTSWCSMPRRRPCWACRPITGWTPWCFPARRPASRMSMWPAIARWQAMTQPMSRQSSGSASRGNSRKP